jgi:subtilisin family serine protease
VANSNEYNINDLKESSDLRGFVLRREGKTLTSLDLRNKYDVLIKTNFDTLTKWPPKNKLPKKFNPLEIIKLCQNPGLGIRELHKKGITGKGVKVAIIDQPLLLNHSEYKNKIAKYTTIDCKNVEPQMHGAAVASLLVGEKCGVAPRASLFFWAEPSWKGDFSQRSSALEQITDYNKGKSNINRIKVVSVSIGYNESFKNLDLWKKSLKKAKQNELLVIHCSSKIAGLNCPLYKNVDDPSNYDVCNYVKKRQRVPPRSIYVPIDNRTTASFNRPKDFVFWSYTGLSWAPPYLAGVIALGYQVNPNLRIDNIIKYLQDTGTSFNKGWIVNPKKFIERVKSLKN